MDPIRVSAKTLEEAITKACIELGAASDMIDYTVVDPGSKGIFGIGAKPCVISASKKPDPEEEMFNRRLEKLDNKVSGRRPKEAKEEKAPARKPEKAEAEEKPGKAPETGDKEGKPEDAASQKAESGEREQRSRRSRRERGERPERNDRGGRKPEVKEGEGTAKEASGSDERKERRGDRGRNDRRNDRRNGRGNRPERAQASENQNQAPAREPQAPKVLLPYVKPEPGTREAKAEDFLRSVFEKMGMEVTVQCQKSEDGTELCVNVSGDDMGVLIGKRGQTLDALQYLTSQVVNKHCQDYVRVKLDTENYRDRRKETLETLAKNIAHKVRRTGKPVALEPMNPYERRIIHSVLQGEKDITTRSEGGEPYRHVVVCCTRRRGRGGRQEQNPAAAAVQTEQPAEEILAEEIVMETPAAAPAETVIAAETVETVAEETVSIPEVPSEASVQNEEQ